MRRMVNENEISQIYMSDNIKAISSDILNKLKAGDIVLKNTNGQLHAYSVSFKKDDEGICLTYSDASVVETISYDYIGEQWVYNSTDITPLNVQSDWNENDNTKVSFIKNKPTIPHLYQYYFDGNDTANESIFINVISPNNFNNLDDLLDWLLNKDEYYYCGIYYEFGTSETNYNFSKIGLIDGAYAPLDIYSEQVGTQKWNISTLSSFRKNQLF